MFTKPRCLSVRQSVLFCLSLLLPFNSKFKSKKKPGIFNLNRPNPKLDPTLCYSNSSTSRYPRTKFSKEKKTRHTSGIPWRSHNHKRSHFCKSQSFCLTTLLWIFMLLGEARKEGIKTREESNTHHSSKDNKSFLRVPKPIATKLTDRENNSSEHRPIKRFMGMSKRRKLTRIATHLKWSSSWSMREKTQQEIGG